MTTIRTIIFIAVTILAWVMVVQAPSPLRWVIAAVATVATLGHLIMRARTAGAEGDR